MKFVFLAIIVVCILDNARLVRGDDVQTLLKMLEEALKLLAKELNSDPDTGLNITEFLDRYNYPWEAHDVTTEDGYILTLHRIPRGRNEPINYSEQNGTRPAIFLVHCLACSAMDWVWQGPDKSLALLLADLGYDVWLANNRGSAHSLRHLTLTPANASFWDFSFHEKGFYDSASAIDHVLNVTGLDKITYVGHSQGTSAALVLTSSRPEYNDKLNLVVLLSPIAYMKHMSSPLVLLMKKYLNIIKVALNLFNIHGMQFSPLLSLVEQTICSNSSAIQGFCITLVESFAGFDVDQIDLVKLSVYLTNTPSGLSVRDAEHYIQELTSGLFRQYDYGTAILNLLHYGTPEPPSYNIGKITAPLAVYYAKNDFLANVTDVERLFSELSHDTVDRYLVEYELFNHLDFIMAKDVKAILYDRVINVINQINWANTTNFNG